MPAAPFVEPVWRRVQASGLKRVAAEVRAGVANEVKKYAKKGKSVYAGGPRR